MPTLLATVFVVVLCRFAAANNVIVMTTGMFDKHLADNKHTLVEFYAPWCGHCKKLEPEYEKAAGTLKEIGVPLGKVDATEEKDLSTKYKVKGFPTMIWFEDGKEMEYDGGRTSESIIEWVSSMTGPAVTETSTLPELTGEKPQIALHAASLLPGFEEAAKANRRKALWYFVKDANVMKVVLEHKGEEKLELTEGCNDKEKVSAFLADNVLPLFGRLDGDSWDKYMDTGRGLVWSLFPDDGSKFEELEAKHRPMMSEVAKSIKGRYFVTITDTTKFKEAIENMLSVTAFLAIAVQKKTGDKKKYVFEGEMTSSNIIKFIDDVEKDKVQPKLKTEPVPASNDDAVRIFVGSTLESELFVSDKDVMLEVYDPWCGHCKKLEPEYQKLAKKIRKEELSDLLTLGKIDGTANDSPIDSVDWTGFPTIFFAKAGTREATVYDGERTAKGLWRYIKKHATKAQEIRERLEKRKGASKKGEEL